MEIFYPYKFEINNQKEALYYIKNQCANCDMQIYCNGNSVKKCNEVIKRVIEEFNNLEQY